MGFGDSSAPTAVSAPPPPPPPPPAANPAVYADPAVQASGTGAKARAAAAKGAGFDGTLMTSPQGAQPASTAAKKLLGE